MDKFTATRSLIEDVFRPDKDAILFEAIAL